MKIVIQRVKEASVSVTGEARAAIASGLLAFVGVAKSDSAADADYLVEKLLNLRLFSDSEGKMNLNVMQAGGSLLIVSQFTLCADCRRGRRPSFDAAAPPDVAVGLYNYLVEQARRGPVPVATGVFQAMMEVRLANDGPVTIVIDSAERGAR